MLLTNHLESNGPSDDMLPMEIGEPVCIWLITGFEKMTLINNDKEKQTETMRYYTSKRQTLASSKHGRDTVASYRIISVQVPLTKNRLQSQTSGP